MTGFNSINPKYCFQNLLRRALGPLDQLRWKRKKVRVRRIASMVRKLGGGSHRSRKGTHRERRTPSCPFGSKLSIPDVGFGGGGCGRAAGRLTKTDRTKAEDSSQSERLIRIFRTGAPALSKKRMAPCQLFCSFRTLNTTTLIPCFKVTLPLSASSSRGRASVNA